MRLGSAVAVLLMFAAAPARAASMPGAYLGDLTWPEAEARLVAAPLVVLAFAPAAKEHGPHLPLNAPNDVVVHPDGGIWFTDPGCGSMMNYEGARGEPHIKEAVYRIDPAAGTLALMTDALAKPNGRRFERRR